MQTAGAVHVVSEAVLTMRGVNFTGNKAVLGDGGALYGSSAGEVELVDLTFTSNEAKDRGGGIVFFLGEGLIIERCIFSKNKGSNGGGAWLGTSYGDVDIVGSEFIDNLSGDVTILAANLCMPSLRLQRGG